MNNYKQQFEEIFKGNIKREGADKLYKFIAESDFFVAPASARFHLAVEGGLVEHSLNVYKRLKQLVDTEKANGNEAFANITEESIAICGLLHDICKVNYYVSDFRNVKENGQWVQKPYYTVNEKFPYGHGEKSVYMINDFMKLTGEEALAINWHMGGFDDRARGGSFSVSTAYARSPFCATVHSADFLATYLDEERSN